MPKPRAFATMWDRILAGTVRNPAVLRIALRQTLVRVLGAAQGQAPRPLLVLLVGPEATSAGLGRLVQRLATSLGMESHLSVDAAAQSAVLERQVTWRAGVQPMTVAEQTRLGADLMCVLTREPADRDLEISSVSLIDVLVWLRPTQGGSKMVAATGDAGEPTT